MPTCIHDHTTKVAPPIGGKNPGEMSALETEITSTQPIQRNQMTPQFHQTQVSCCISGGEQEERDGGGIRNRELAGVGSQWLHIGSHYCIG